MISESKTNPQKGLTEKPISHFCGLQDYSSQFFSTVHYSSLLYSRSNERTKGGGLDKISGVYTASMPGYYTITYTLKADVSFGKILYNC